MLKKLTLVLAMIMIVAWPMVNRAAQTVRSNVFQTVQMSLWYDGIPDKSLKPVDKKPTLLPVELVKAMEKTKMDNKKN